MACMRPRWSASEVRALELMREALGEKLLARKKRYPDLVGDRRLLRFLRGSQLDVPRACEKYSKFLDWWDANNLDAIRYDILHGGRNDPLKFPSGAKILQIFPQVIVAANARDHIGNPVSVECYNFSPSELLKNIPQSDYRLFALYCLEYKVLVMDQLAHEQELYSLREHPTSVEPYGVILKSFYIRDFDGFSLEHLGGEGQSLLAWVLETATANYPELLFESHLVNVPWIFNFLWVFIRPFLDSATLSKIHIHGTGAGDFALAVRDKISVDAIPEFLGGQMKCSNEAFFFDTSPAGAFHVAGARHAQELPESPLPSQPPQATTPQESAATAPLETDDGKPLSRSVEHSLLKNPFAWLMYLRICFLVPVASTLQQVHARRPILSAAVLGAVTISASTLINHYLSLREVENLAQRGQEP